MKVNKHIYILLAAMAAVFSLLVSCREESSSDDPRYGYVQFRVVNSSLTKADTDRLEHLSDARKVKVVMLRDGSTITQTIPLNFYSQENADFGLRSDKLSLLAGTYSVIGFYLYDALDNLLITGDTEADREFEVPADGLVVKDLGVLAVSYGKVTFRLIKDFVTSRAEEGAEYPFSKIRSADITVMNTFSREKTEFRRVPVSIKVGFAEDGRETSYAVCDTVAKLAAGSYRIVSYATYSDRAAKSMIEIRDISGPVFNVEPEVLPSEADVPIKLLESAEYIKDYVALKEIWEALDGPSWKYNGIGLVPGSNWNFNKDMDLWGDQPGVSLGNDGRVTSIDLSGFGARGDIPDAIGQLTDIQVLYLGTHNESLGGYPDAGQVSSMSGAQLQKHRMDYYHRTAEKDVRENLSDALQTGIGMDSNQRPIVKNDDRVSPDDIRPGILTNGITGISRAIMRLKNLQQLYIANSPMTVEHFFVDIKPDSPFFGEDLTWADMEMFTDVEIYNCPQLTGLPLDMLVGLPELQALNIAGNRGISAERLKAEWEEIIDGNSGPRLQILYLDNTNIREFPEYEQLKKMVKMGYLQCVNSDLEKVHPFGREVQLAQVILDNNNIEEIPAAPDGQFCGFEQLEKFTASNNKIKEVPDIFNAKSVYEFDEVDLSHNEISGFANGSAHKGINAKTIDLSYNKFDEFPSQIFKTGSPCEYLIFAGNGLRSIETGSLVGSNSQRLMSIDLSFNKLKELPASDFYATNLPYLYGVDLSYNSFDYFPTEVLDAAGVTVLALRHQRDDEGNRTLKTWPSGIYQHCPSLQALYLSSNDIRKVSDTITWQISILEVSDNPNITMTVSSSACTYWQYGYLYIIYDKTQDIRGCPAMLE